MAGNKVTDFGTVESVLAADLLYLIRSSSSTDEQVSLTTLFGTLPVPIKTTERLFLGGTSQSFNNDGIISQTQTTTVVTNDTTATLTITNGDYDGQIKVILFQSGSATSTITGSNLFSSIALTTPGQAVILFWLGTKWWKIV